MEKRREKVIAKVREVKRKSWYRCRRREIKSKRKSNEEKQEEKTR